MTDTSVRPSLAQRLAADPDGIVERIAEEYAVSPFAVITLLPSAHRTIVDGGVFERVMHDIATWGDILLIVHTKGIVLEAKGPLPVGSFARGYYNLSGDSPIGGHIKADRCTHVAFVSRPFMGRSSRSVQFFDGDGEAMFKVFVRRDAARELLAPQVERFEALRARLQRETA